MAGLPRRSEELPLTRHSGLLLLFLVLAPRPGPLRAQEPGEPAPASNLVRGSIGLSPSLTRVLGETRLLAGVSAMIEVSPRWRAGGAGHAVLGDVSFGQDPVESRVRLGYGGVLVEWSWRGAADAAAATGARLTLLAGAGNAELRQLPFGIRVGSDNFFVMEPGALLERRISRRLSVGAGARYRLSLGVDDLPGIDGRDLSGPALGLELRLGPF